MRVWKYEKKYDGSISIGDKIPIDDTVGVVSGLEFDFTKDTVKVLLKEDPEMIVKRNNVK